MLRAMRRERSGAAHPRGSIARIRAAVPGIALRTAFIVGFPGETEDDVASCCDFIEEAEFEHVGVFRYSQEENTPAATLPGQLPERVKQARWERVMETRRPRRGAPRPRAGRPAVEVLVEGEATPGGLSVGRTRDAGARRSTASSVSTARRRRRDRAGARDRRGRLRSRG